MQQEHVDSWPELKDSTVKTSFLKMQGSIMFAATVTQDAAESVSMSTWTQLASRCLPRHDGSDGCFIAMAILGVLVAVYVGVRF